MQRTQKITKIIIAIFIMVLSSTVLFHKVPETKFLQSSVESLQETQNTVTAFAGTSIATSIAISALPNDMGSPLADTMTDLNKYFVFMLAVVVIEKLIVLEGTKIALAYIIPAACLLYIIHIVLLKEALKKFATKLLILGISIVLVVPISTHVTETVCNDYLAYVDETIAETNAGTNIINDTASINDNDSTVFTKLTDTLETAIQNVADLFTYLNNLVKKCITAVAIMLVTTFILPIVILLVFRWILKELFSLNVPMPKFKIRPPRIKEDEDEIPSTPSEE